MDPFAACCSFETVKAMTAGDMDLPNLQRFRYDNEFVHVSKLISCRMPKLR